MDLYEACENGNEERVVEALLYGEHWHGRQRHLSSSPQPPSPSRSSTAFRSNKATYDGGGDTTATASPQSVASSRSMLHARGIAGRTPLLTACMGGQLGVVQLLLGETCTVYFTSRTGHETEQLLKPLADEYTAFEHHQGATPTEATHTHHLFQVSLATKDDGSDLVPVAGVRLPPARTVMRRDLLDGATHVDDFGNTPLQCVSCFGCGSRVRHIDDGLAITRVLLRHGDQPNLPKMANRWTPLHWAAYNGNHEQCVLLLDPPAVLSSLAVTTGSGGTTIGKTQFSIPLLVNSDDLFAADVAGRRALALRQELLAIRALPLCQRNEYAQWRLRLDPVQVLRVFTSEFLQNATSLVRYVADMNARLPSSQVAFVKRDATRTPNKNNAKRRSRRFTCADAVRYGQHLLYWMGCFGLVDDVRALLEMRLELPTEDALEFGAQVATVVVDTGHKNSHAVPFTVVHLRPLYVCSCEENKLQSVLHAVGVHGQQEIVRLLLSHLLFEQQHPHTAALISPRDPQPQQLSTNKIPIGLASKKYARAAIVPATGNTTTTVSSSSSTTTPATTPSVAEEAVDRSDKLDVLALADTGWRNYRGESPLFLAVLFLQHDVVTIFTALLSPASIAWELGNCNVEGSFIYHIASDFAKRELQINDQQPQAHEHHQRPHTSAEYVLVFDGLTKRHFKESLIDSMREESASAPSLVVTRAGHTPTSAVLGGLWRQAARRDYVVVGATERVLVQHAQALQLKIKHRGSSLRSKYNAATPHVFEPFRSLQRQQVVLDILQKNVNLKKHLTKRNVQAIFPLHDASGCKNIMRHWAVDARRKRVFQPFVGDSLWQFLLEKRTHQYEMLWPLLTYFGEKHAFYYAFMLFYTVWLLMIAVPGAICQLLWSLGLASYAAPLFAVFVSLWATLFVERWKRKRSEIQSTFGNFKRNRSELAPEFYGDFQVDLSRERAVVDTKFPKSLQLARIYAGVPVLVTMASVAVAIFVGVKLNASTTAILEELFPWLPRKLASYVIPVLNAVSMIVLDTVYTRVAVRLTQWENHRTVWQFESMLATKLFWFKFLNAFLSLFWVAFVDRDAAALRKQLVVIMGARQLWYMAQRSIYPLLAVARAWRRAGFQLRERGEQPHSKTRKSTWALTHEWYYAELAGSDANTTTSTSATPTATTTTDTQRPPLIVLLQELMEPPDFLLGKQMEVVLQFGYITMFVSVLPIAPLLALLSNVVSTRLDVICCTQAKRRPPFESETEVSTFMSILEFMSFAAVAVNCAVLFFTTMDDFESLLAAASSFWHLIASTATSPSTGLYLEKLWILLVVEHGVLGLKALLSLTIEDAATWVQNDDDRNDDEAKQSDAQLENARLVESAQLTGRRSNGDAGSPSSAMVSDLVSGPGPTLSSTAVQRVLLEKYETAMQERDAARANERQLRLQLSECQRRLRQQLTAMMAASHGSTETAAIIKTMAAMDDLGGDSTTKTRSSSSFSRLSPPLTPPSRTCVICFVLFFNKSRSRVGSASAQRRCVACHQFFCRACDELVHLDDIGVREPKHFRVDVPAEGEDPEMEDRDALVAAAGLDLPADASSELQDEELLVLLEMYVRLEQHPTPPVDIQQTARSLLMRCRGYEPLAVRYLRNVARRQKYAKPTE